MRPYVLHGQSRPITQVKYNREGDLLFTAARDKTPTVWRTTNGERLGTYVGHDGAVNSLDISANSELLVTGSADSTGIVWRAEDATIVHSWTFQTSVRSVSIAPDMRHVALATSMLMKQEPEIHVMRLDEDPSKLGADAETSFTGPQKTITRALWTATGEHMIGASEDGSVRKWDVETGKELVNALEHSEQIKDLQMSADGLQFITASSDKTAKLWDLMDMKVIKVYKMDRPVNSAAISPLMNHVLIGGGQDARDVTTSAVERERFEARFYHKIYENEFGSVRGHFGPINSVAMSPDGRQFTTGSEESTVRMANFDEEYYTRKLD